MSRHGELIRPDTLRFERVLPGPIETVWAFLTEPDKRKRWLAGGIVEDRRGGQVEMVFRNSELGPNSADIPAKYKGHEGMRFTGTVTRYEPPRVFAHTWDETEVIFELSETEDGRVRLVLTQTGAIDSEERLGVLAGWHTHLDILEAELEDREPASFWDLHAGYEEDYRQRMEA